MFLYGDPVPPSMRAGAVALGLLLMLIGGFELFFRYSLTVPYLAPGGTFSVLGHTISTATGIGGLLGLLGLLILIGGLVAASPTVSPTGRTAGRTPLGRVASSSDISGFQIKRDKNGLISFARTTQKGSPPLALEVESGVEGKRHAFYSFDFQNGGRKFLRLTEWISLAHERVYFRSQGDLDMSWVMRFRGYHRTHKVWITGRVGKDTFAAPYYPRLGRQVPMLSPEYWMPQRTRALIDRFNPVFRQMISDSQRRFGPFRSQALSLMLNSPGWADSWPTFCHTAGNMASNAVGTLVNAGTNALTTVAIEGASAAAAGPEVEPGVSPIAEQLGDSAGDLAQEVYNQYAAPALSNYVTNWCEANDPSTWPSSVPVQDQGDHPYDVSTSAGTVTGVAPAPESDPTAPMSLSLNSLGSVFDIGATAPAQYDGAVDTDD